MRYEKEMQELKEQRAAIKARINELNAEYKSIHKNSGWVQIVIIVNALTP